jgi:hypothetical protein
VDGLSYDPPSDLPDVNCVPYHISTIPGLQVKPSKWGNGVFWEGDSTLLKGVYVTIYSGRHRVMEAAKLNFSTSAYVLECKHLTERHPPTYSYMRRYIDGSCGRDDFGLGQYINSSSPLNIEVLERFPNCRFVEHFLDHRGLFVDPQDSFGYRVLVQTIADIEPGDELLVYYHRMLPCAIECGCYKCV